jgi:nicotinamide riboside kinase
VGTTMTKKIVFIGSAGSGKSTISFDLVTSLKKSGINAEHIPEMIRYDIQRNGPMENVWEQYRSFLNQHEYEDNIPKEVDYAVIDSGCLTPYFYACLYTSTATERERLVLADMFKYLIDMIYKKQYDYIFFLPRKHTIERAGLDKISGDGTRYQSMDELDVLDKHMELMFTKILKSDTTHMLTCSLEDRLDSVLKILNLEIA